MISLNEHVFVPSGRRRRRLREMQRGEEPAEEDEDEDEEGQRLAFIDRPDLDHGGLREVLEMPRRLQEVLASPGSPGRRLVASGRNHTGGHRERGTTQHARNHTRAAARTSVRPPKTSPKTSPSHSARDHSLKASRKISPGTSPQTSPAVRPAPKTPTKTAPRMFRGAVQPPNGRTHQGVLLGLGVGNGDDTDTG